MILMLGYIKATTLPTAYCFIVAFPPAVAIVLITVTLRFAAARSVNCTYSVQKICAEKHLGSESCLLIMLHVNDQLMFCDIHDNSDPVVMCEWMCMFYIISNSSGFLPEVLHFAL